MECNFDNRPSAPVQEQPTPAPDVAQQPTTTAVAATPRYDVPAVKEPIVIGDFLPSFKDVILPRINLVHNTGELKDTFTPGELVYAQSTVIYSPPKVNLKTGQQESAGTPPVIITFIGRVRERFVEKTKFGSGQRGVIVADEASVRNCGGTLDWDEHRLKEKDGMKLFEPLHEMLVAIERPECCADDGTLFVFEATGKKYTFGFWDLKGSAYTEVLKKVVYLHRTMGPLRGEFPNGGFPAYSYAISTWNKPFKTGNTVPVPRAVPHQKSTPEFLELVRGFVSRNA